MLAMARMFDTSGLRRRRRAPALLASSVVSCRKISSRLRRDGRSSTRPQSLDTTRRATSRRRSSPLWQSISKLVSVPRWSTGVTRDTPGTPPSAAATSMPAGASTCTKIVWLPWMRSVSASGVSIATTLPLLMMTTRSQVCETSGRMCVLRMIVCEPASPLMRSRVSMICFGSRPAVGSSRIRTSGLCRIAWASPTRCL